MIPFALAGLVTATLAAKAHYDQEQRKLQAYKETDTQDTPVAYLTHEQAKSLCVAIAQLQRQVHELEEEMKTKATIH